MNRAVLDTDILSEVLKRKDPAIIARAEAYLAEHGRFTITAVTVLEVVAGWQRRQRDDRVREFLARLPEFDVLALDATAAARAGRLEGDLTRLGRIIGVADSMIAAIALTHDLPLVTGNTAHYARVLDLGVPLVLENWRAAP